MKYTSKGQAEKECLQECNNNYVILAFNILKNSKRTISVLETCREDRNKNIIKD